MVAKQRPSKISNLKGCIVVYIIIQKDLLMIGDMSIFIKWTTCVSNQDQKIFRRLNSNIRLNLRCVYVSFLLLNFVVGLKI